MAKSIEEKIEDLCKKQLNSVNYYTKTDFINEEIENALRKYPSKKGGKGANYRNKRIKKNSCNDRSERNKRRFYKS